MSAELPLYPWQKQDWQNFQQLSKRLPHGLLLTGVSGGGKLRFALNMAKSLLCETKNGCDQCNNCALFGAGSHPDLHLVFTELLTANQDETIKAYSGRYLEDFEKAKKRKPRRIISVDQIRELIRNASLSHHSATHKVIIIAPADKMNINASNALLKLLEEPPEDTVLILVSSSPEILPVTIRSRCVPLVINTPEHENAMAWLKAQHPNEEVSLLMRALNLSSGGPLQASLAIGNGDLIDFDTMLAALDGLFSGKDNPITVSDKLSKLFDGRRFIDWLQSLVKTALEAESNGSQASSLAIHDGLRGALTAVPKSTLFGFYDQLIEYKRHDVEQLNQQLLIEQILLKLTAMRVKRA
ncbi:MAG: DNA polymerase-3 subunit delta' [Saprospiraceae bacterium]|jgi:DNA polymerase-3 subunit delta'